MGFRAGDQVAPPSRLISVKTSKKLLVIEGNVGDSRIEVFPFDGSVGLSLMRSTPPPPPPPCPTRFMESISVSKNRSVAFVFVDDTPIVMEISAKTSKNEKLPSSETDCLGPRAVTAPEVLPPGGGRVISVKISKNEPMRHTAPLVNSTLPHCGVQRKTPGGGKLLDPNSRSGGRSS